MSTGCRLGLALALALATGVGSAARAQERVELTYATMRDGIQLALAVTYPRDYDPARRYPAMFSMSGYKWSVYPLGESRDYFMVHASMRGTGCSGGEFHLFGESVGYDGYDVIESWIVRQPWSNGRVGITGHSFWGLVGFQVAATNPPHAVAAGVSGLIDDFYRGIVYTGGVLNYGFPVAWGLARHQADSEQEAWAYRGQDELDRGDSTCAENIAQHAVVYPFLPLALATAYDGPFWQEHALERIAPRIRIPIHLRQQYQDEQTGPGGYRLWELVPGDTPKRIVFSNGEHDGPTGQSDRSAWLRCWVIDRGEGCAGDLLDPAARVQVHFDTLGPRHAATIHAPLAAGEYPLPDTDWRTLHLRADGSLGAEPGAGETSTFETLPAADARPRPGLHPTALTFELPFETPTAFFGPSIVTLDAVVEGADAELFVEIADRWPDGRLEFLQRGMLRASRAAVEASRSDAVASGPAAGTVYRPWHPHTPESSVVPALPTSPLRIEVPAWGHVFQPGHQLVLRLSSPPAQDRVGGTYSYLSPFPSANVVVRHDGDSTLLLARRPQLPEHAAVRACGDLWGIPCHAEPPSEAERFEGAGCIATPSVSPTCSFVATGPHTYSGEAVNELAVRIYRDGEVVYETRKGGGLGSPYGNLPWTGSIPSVAGDVVEGEIVPGCAGPVCGEAGTLVVGNPAGG